MLCHSGAARGGEPGTHDHQPIEVNHRATDRGAIAWTLAFMGSGLRAPRPRNDEWGFRQVLPAV
jgi:hypothetical protein